MISSILNWLKEKSGLLYLVLLVICAALLLVYVVEQFAQMQAFVFNSARAILAITLYWFLDERVLMPKLHTEMELKNGNIAYAIYQVGLLLLIGMLLSTY